MNTITINQAKQDLNSLIEQVVTDVKPTIICNKKGRKAVLMPLDEFNSWQETIYLLSNPANAEHLQKSIEQAKVGKIAERELID
ncbi:type II toxin-antitoxin system prevent-host-death family antitoxin [candidate division KSB1 bacterium]|nr:type II toxin-antitoxin system prevent-host-death family antitoxin [candidate division KSB1 bacterium]MBL7095589.1 type II toxin-antitoxin system prevent-host-death family antitoxin [candidate division KSB1 bacterium]